MTLDEFQLSLVNHKPTDDTVRHIEVLRASARQLGIDIFREAPDSRERSIALTKLEEAVMWAVKATVLPRQETLV